MSSRTGSSTKQSEIDKERLHRARKTTQIMRNTQSMEQFWEKNLKEKTFPPLLASTWSWHTHSCPLRSWVCQAQWGNRRKYDRTLSTSSKVSWQFPLLLLLFFMAFTKSHHWRSKSTSYPFQTSWSIIIDILLIPSSSSLRQLFSDCHVTASGRLVSRGNGK